MLPVSVFPGEGSNQRRTKSVEWKNDIEKIIENSPQRTMGLVSTFTGRFVLFGKMVDVNGFSEPFGFKPCFFSIRLKGFDAAASFFSGSLLCRIVLSIGEEKEIRYFIFSLPVPFLPMLQNFRR